MSNGRYSQEALEKTGIEKDHHELENLERLN